MAEIETPDPAPSDPYVAAHPETRAFWDAAEAGHLMLPTCRRCGEAHWYPRSFCPFCHSEDVDWREASGTGAIYSFSTLRRSPTPYVVALVTLTEGPTMMTNLVDCPPDALAIGAPVEVRFMKAPEGRTIPVFRPCADPSA